MNIDKEYAGLFELIAWLDKFKAELDAQKVQQPTLTVVPEPVQDELPIADDKVTQKLQPVNARKRYTPLEVELMNVLRKAGCDDKEIARFMQRDVEGVARKLRHGVRGR